MINPIQLRDHFETLISIYRISEAGKTIAEWLKEDWLLFPKMDPANAMLLLVEVLDDGNITRHKFSPNTDHETISLDAWNAFRTELMHQNRFFPNSALDQDRLESLVSHINIQAGELGTNWFRARVQEEDKPYTADKMGAPPERKATHGRANPAGIPYLYLASDSTTAISEIRPHTGELINVAKFSIDRSLELVDLRRPRELVSPFVLADETEISLLRQDIGFLEYLGNELMRPVLPKAAAIDYIPSQYLCEFIKKCGFAGVIYNSSVGEGINLALFNPDDAYISNEITQRSVSRVSIETK
ncbi:RES family NAD+ phosphorylase [Paremcibacter congregatus]|uniref:RES family NAD+ phosphorylase n=1 Tax=Paremcibacter congregatus TaxID=2043170 RepID=UPI0030ED57C3